MVLDKLWFRIAFFLFIFNLKCIQMVTQVCNNYRIVLVFCTRIPEPYNHNKYWNKFIGNNFAHIRIETVNDNSTIHSPLVKRTGCTTIKERAHTFTHNCFVGAVNFPTTKLIFALFICGHYNLATLISFYFIFIYFIPLNTK